MVYTVMSGHNGLKLADKNSSLWKYGTKKTMGTASPCFLSLPI